jgi:hypothetical protein
MRRRRRRRRSFCGSWGNESEFPNLLAQGPMFGALMSGADNHVDPSRCGMPPADCGYLPQDGHGPIIRARPGRQRDAVPEQTVLPRAFRRLLNHVGTRRQLFPAPLADWISMARKPALKGSASISCPGVRKSRAHSENGGYWAMNPGYDRPDYPGSIRAVSARRKRARSPGI